MKTPVSLLLIAIGVLARGAEISPQRVEQAAAEVDAKVVAWRHDLHQHPELGNREFRTAALVAKHLTALGLEIKTGLAHTGVAGILRGGRPGPVIALRAEMDALPVTEETDLPFKSTATAEYRGQTVGVMHACGHDTHTAMLLGVAEALAGLRPEMPGTVLFIFQPAEEGPPEGEQGGARLMLAEGLFDLLRPEAVFGLHVISFLNTGIIGYRSGPALASADSFRLVVHGRQTHGARPWDGIDPIVVSSQIVLGLQTIISRQTDISELPAIVTVGAIRGGIRHNIIPDAVEMLGTIRTFDAKVRDDTITRMRRTAEGIAAASGTTAELRMEEPSYPVTVNDPALTTRVVPSLTRVVGEDNVRIVPRQTVAEDFAYYGQKVPGFYFFVGITPRGQDAATAPANHSPRFFVDEAGLGIGLRAMLQVAVDYLQGTRPAAPARSTP